MTTDDILQLLIQAQEVIYFNSMDQIAKRMVNRTPETEKRTQIDAWEKEAIARHEKINGIIPSG